MKLGFKQIILATALVWAGSLTAQEENEKEMFQKNNWFVTGGVTGEYLTNTTGNMFAGAKVGGGIYLDRYSALRATFFAGKNRVETLKANQYAVELDYMLTLIGNKEYRPFNLAAIIGASYNYFGTKKLTSDSKNVSAIGGTLAFQASYNVNRRLSVYLEPSVSIMPRFYNGKNEDKVFAQSALSIGVTYTFKDRFKASAKSRHTVPADKGDVRAIQQKMNEMMQELEQLRKENREAIKAGPNQNVVLEPAQQKRVNTIQINFEEFSSFISAEQAGKLDNVGEWMNGNPAAIKIVAFSDNAKDRVAEKELRDQRTDAIKKMLVEKYRIAPERIASATPESMGYANKTGNTAMIIFIPSNL